MDPLCDNTTEFDSIDEIQLMIPHEKKRTINTVFKHISGTTYEERDDNLVTDERRSDQSESWAGFEAAHCATRTPGRGDGGGNHCGRFLFRRNDPPFCGIDDVEKRPWLPRSSCRSLAVNSSGVTAEVAGWNPASVVS